jgi:hypothetical protein
MDCHNSAIRDLIQGVPYRMKASDSSLDQNLGADEVIGVAILLPVLQMSVRQNRDDIDVRICLEKHFHRTAENRLSTKLKKPFRSLRTHSGTASSGHNHHVFFPLHNLNFFLGKNTLFIAKSMRYIL